MYVAYYSTMIYAMNNEEANTTLSLETILAIVGSSSRSNRHLGMCCALQTERERPAPAEGTKFGFLHTS